MSGTTLTDWLRARGDEALAAVLRARPDLATPRPANTGVLAARAATRASVTRVAEGLDTFTLAVLDALLAAGADREPVPLTVVDLDVSAQRVRAAAKQLRELAVAWGDDDGISLVPAAREAGGLFPTGLGRPSPALEDVDIAKAVAELPTDEQDVLTRLASNGPIGSTRDAAAIVALEQAKTPIQRLLARGLLTRVDATTVELPRQVGLVVRPESAVVVDEPKPKTKAHKAVDSTAAGAALEFLRYTKTLLRSWSEEPVPVLKAGGLGSRDLRKLTKVLDIGERDGVLLVEVAVAASLVVDNEAATPEYVPTHHSDTWLTASPANQWATLAAAWLDLPRLPGIGGMRDAKERLLAPLSEDLRRPVAPLERVRVLRALADLKASTGIVDPDELAALLAWRAPRRGGRLRDEIVRWTLQEATALGIVAHGALTGPGRTLLEEGTAAAAKRMAEVMPEPIDHVLVQADLTVVAPGPLEPHLAMQINEVADVESAGSATVYRVSETSLRRALDGGQSASDLHELFRTSSRTPVPQSLTYMIDDVARRHGRLRGGATAAFLRCDDPALIAEVAASPVAAALRLRKIAPTVLVSPVALVEILDELRAAGFTPAAEDSEGQVVDLRPSGRRVQAAVRAVRRVAPKGPDDDQLIDIVQSMRAGDRAADSKRSRPTVPANTADTLALLQGAVRAQQTVWVGMVDANGVASERLLRPQRIGGGVLEGTDPDTEGVTRIPLHRITRAALVE
ncbi:2-phospho-L-lactate guanylyltransferase (CobY/MobA/RfbA family) [Actinokineospora baliensis]|uniref:helicase-associated domain-containing protein n=1 Tax=Actinokineospora baliensis TaxID=547056 RepID=UPI001957C8CC|nr:helicase-associated domain-containing protein [Actinokineospora baliensis]MBM7771581.1 2-phospho-L-lactate guanylyltransferase (CobY/MobA/RfbA family) [Actinokineospora baliensis]